MKKCCVGPEVVYIRLLFVLWTLKCYKQLIIHDIGRQQSREAAVKAPQWHSTGEHAHIGSGGQPGTNKSPPRGSAGRSKRVSGGIPEGQIAAKTEASLALPIACASSCVTWVYAAVAFTSLCPRSC